MDDLFLFFKLWKKEQKCPCVWRKLRLKKSKPQCERYCDSVNYLFRKLMAKWFLRNWFKQSSASCFSSLFYQSHRSLEFRSIVKYTIAWLTKLLTVTVVRLGKYKRVEKKYAELLSFSYKQFSNIGELICKHYNSFL